MIDNFSKLNKRATIQSIVEVSDGFGGVDLNYIPIKNIWCLIENIAHSEAVFLAKKKIIATHKILTRFDPAIPDQFRIKYKEKIFEVQFVSIAEDICRWLELFCTEVL